MPDSHPVSRDMLDAALDLATQGVRVFPLHTPTNGSCSCGRPDCHSPGKHPRIAHGVRAASDNPDQIWKWWTRWPDANIAVATGHGLIVVDVDGPEGQRSLTELYRNLGALPATRTVVTGNGHHYYLTVPDDLKITNSASKLATGVDIRGHNGYVVAPPSVHISGVTYQWSAHTPIAPTPHEWIAALSTPPPAPSSPPVARDLAPGRIHDGSAHPYALTALTREMERVALAPVGQRNDTLNAAAYRLGQLAHSGHLNLDHVTTQLLIASETAGLTDTESRATIRSGLTAGQQTPRPIPQLDRASKPTPTAPAQPERNRSRSSPVRLYRYGTDGWRWTVTHDTTTTTWRTGPTGHGLWRLTKSSHPNWQPVATRQPWELPRDRNNAYRAIIRSFTARAPQPPTHPAHLPPQSPTGRTVRAL